jgi:hypothetical protein
VSGGVRGGGGGGRGGRCRGSLDEGEVMSCDGGEITTAVPPPSATNSEKSVPYLLYIQ